MGKNNFLTQVLTMTTQYFHSKVNDIVPFQATYNWPSQSTKVHKQTVKIQTKNGSTYGPRSKIRFEFPSDGYMNMLQSRVVFDFTVTSSKSKQVFSGAVSGLGSNTTDVTADADQNLPITTDIGSRATHIYVPTTGNTGLSETSNHYLGYVVYIPELKMSALVEKSEKHATKDIVTLKTSATIPAASSLTVILLPGIKFGSTGAQELFSLERVTYGGTVLEEIRNRQQLARGLHNLGVSQASAASQGTLTDGRQGGYVYDDTLTTGHSSVVDADAQSFLNMGVTYRYSVPLISGLFNCNKLLPLKWLAAQWALELEVGDVSETMITTKALLDDSSLTFTLSNVHFCTELLEFPDTYDTAFYVGLSNGGVPIKFNTWRYHTFNITGTTNHLQIHERARSIKAAYAWVVDRTQKSRACDRYAAFFKLNSKLEEANNLAMGSKITKSTDAKTEATGRIKQYQYRVGGSYFPAQPVDCSNGGVEAYNELLKALDGMNDFTFNHNIRPSQWTGFQHIQDIGEKFCMALEFEHADVVPDTITGISGEEQSDIALQIDLTDAPEAGYAKAVDVFLAVDAMIVIGTGNTVKLIM